MAKKLSKPPTKAKGKQVGKPKGAAVSKSAPSKSKGTPFAAPSKSKAVAPSSSNKDVPKATAGEVVIADTRRLPALGFSYNTYNPDDLVGRKGLAVYDEMRKDDQVKACLMLKKSAIVGPGWKLEATKSRDQGAIDLADQVTRMMLDVPGTFQSKLYDLLSALDYGFAIGELVWNLGDEVTLKDIKIRAPHDIYFEQDEFGNIESIRQGIGQQVEVPPEKVLHLVYRGEFSNPYGTSDLRECWQDYWYKKNWKQWWAVFAEKLADPPVLGMHPPTAGKPQVDEVMEVLRRLQAHTALMVPGPTAQGGSGWEIKLLETTRDPRTFFESAINFFNSGIARGLLVPDKLGLSSDGAAGGSFAMAQTQMGAFFFVLQMLSAWLEACVQTVVDRLVAYNFGEAAEVPKFKLLPLSEENKERIATIWMQAVQTGAVVGDLEDENHLRQLIGFPEKDEDERAAFEKQQMEKQRQMFAMQGKGPDGQPPQNQQQQEQGGDKKPPFGGGAKGGPPFGGQKGAAPAKPAKPAKIAAEEGFWREPTPLEARTDLAEKQRDFSMLTTPLAESLAGSMEKIVHDLRTQVKTVKTFDDVKKLRLSESTLTDVRKAIAQGLRAAYTRGSDQAAKEINRARAEFRELYGERLDALERTALEKLWALLLHTPLAVTVDSLKPRNAQGQFTK